MRLHNIHKFNGEIEKNQTFHKRTQNKNLKLKERGLNLKSKQNKKNNISMLKDENEKQ